MIILNKIASFFNNRQLTLGSLFSGIGGFELAFANVGIKTLWSNDIDKKACKTLEDNFNHNIVCCDIKEFCPMQSVDIITAGFPCQSFSIAGYKKGFKDPRGSVFFEIIRIVKYLNPRVLLLENVDYILKHDKGKTMKTILASLEDIGYNVTYKLLNTRKYSKLPQNRKRVYIVAFLHQEDFNEFKFPEPVNVSYSVADLLDKEVDMSYYYNDSYKHYQEMKKQAVKKNTCYRWEKKLIESRFECCPTLVSSMGRGGHNMPIFLDDKGVRKMTIKECYRFQGYPEYFKIPDFSKTVLYKQIGNSVSIPVVEALAREIKKVISQKILLKKLKVL